MCNCVFKMVVSQKHPFAACFKQAPYVICQLNNPISIPSHPGVPCNGVVVCAVCAAATAPMPSDRAIGAGATGTAVGDGLWELAACLGQPSAKPVGLRISLQRKITHVHSGHGFQSLVDAGAAAWPILIYTVPDVH